ncbi:MAG: CBS domain-containing protein [Planctomycetales bacterium]|nr:CBS domain-containing protein [Planctomycetales bacterium]
MLTPAETPSARDFMNTHVYTVEADASLEEVIKVLKQHRVSNVPVVDRNTNPPRLLGFLSEADCLEHLSNELFYGMPAPQMTAETMMKRHPVCVAPDTNIFTLASVLVNHRLRHLPVVEGGGLLGIVSRRDVLKALDAYYREATQRKETARRPLDLRQIVSQRFVIHDELH